MARAILTGSLRGTPAPMPLIRSGIDSLKGRFAWGPITVAGVHLVVFLRGEGCQLGRKEDQALKSGHFFGSSQGTGEDFAIFGPQPSFGDLQGLEAAGGGDELPHVFYRVP